MKKTAVFVTLGLFLGLAFLSSCGDGGAAEEARMKAIQDSLRQDSINQVMEAQRIADSLAQDSLAALNDSLAAALGEKPKVIVKEKIVKEKDPVTTFTNNVKEDAKTVTDDATNKVNNVKTTKTNTQNTGTQTTKTTKTATEEKSSGTTTKTTKTKSGGNP